MNAFLLFLAISAALVVTGCGENAAGPSGQSGPSMSFFVSSAKSTTGNLGGLRGADALCQNLAAAAGVGTKSWRAYLSVERDPDNNNGPTDARSRIGTGPWLNVNGVAIARDLNEPGLYGPNREEMAAMCSAGA